MEEIRELILQEKKGILFPSFFFNKTKLQKRSPSQFRESGFNIDILI